MTPLASLLADIKISHTIFAMPFAVLGAFMAGTQSGSIIWSTFGWQLGLIVICMIFARTVAMLANRILDRDIDARNPRTENRALPRGAVTQASAIGLLAFSALTFIAATAAFGVVWNNWLPLSLSIPVLVWLCVYPLLKRFTWLCHIYLGASLSLSPVAAAIAVQPELAQHLSIWLLSGAVLFWVAGFDIIYSLQDVENDLRDNLKSIPASLGVAPAMLISQLLHCLCVALLFGVSLTESSFSWLFLGAICIIAGLLVYEHFTVKKWGTTKIALTFFMINGVVSCLLGTAGVVDLLLSSQ